MKACTFFGHWYTPDTVERGLYALLKELILRDEVTNFYIGNQGHFDKMAYRCLKELKKEYSYIDYTVVLAYISENKTSFLKEIEEKSIFPEELDKTPPRFAIDKRNRWMINKSDIVVTYVTDVIGGAAKYKELAERKGKTVYNLGTYNYM